MSACLSGFPVSLEVLLVEFVLILGHDGSQGLLVFFLFGFKISPGGTVTVRGYKTGLGTVTVTELAVAGVLRGFTAGERGTFSSSGAFRGTFRTGR